MTLLLHYRLKTTTNVILQSARKTVRVLAPELGNREARFETRFCMMSSLAAAAAGVLLFQSHKCHEQRDLMADQCGCISLIRYNRLWTDMPDWLL